MQKFSTNIDKQNPTIYERIKHYDQLGFIPGSQEYNFQLVADIKNSCMCAQSEMNRNIVHFSSPAP